jgi:hypothetical protein
MIKKWPTLFAQMCNEMKGWSHKSGMGEMDHTRLGCIRYDFRMSNPYGFFKSSVDLGVIINASLSISPD